MKKKQGFGTKIVSWVPFGLGKTKPHHFREMAQVAWENRDNLAYASRILFHGVCDGCSLGPYGLRDHTIKGIHLCMTRLRMLRMNTMRALDVSKLSDVQSLQSLTGEQLRNLGRLPYPMVRFAGDKGFRRISWEEAMAIAAKHFSATEPQRFAMYTTSRGLTNEVYYVAGKFTRLLQTNNIDNAARLCHAASTAALKQTVGAAAATCSYRDWIWTELIVLAGANIANNQPVATKYLYYAKEKGARIVVVNPYREPGLEEYWIPSIAKSALFGTRLMDDFFPIMVGGDVAFFNGVAKILIENDWVDQEFINNHTNGFEELKKSLAQQDWETLETQSGTSRSEMLRFAKIYAGVKTAVFIWSMGLTQHRFGVENVKSLVNVALARGMIGKPNMGLVPIRGHSGVQGAAEVGSVPTDYVAGLSVNEENARKLSAAWGFSVPFEKGLSAPEMIDAAHEGNLDIFYIAGGNFLDTMPEPIHAREALERVPLRIHQDIVLNSSMFAEPKDAVLLFPAQTRYEQKGGGTITSTERRIRFSPEIPGPRIGEARSEWEIMVDLAQHILPPEKQKFLAFRNAEDIRAEMNNVIPLYKGISDLKKEKDSFQYGGARILNDGICQNLPDQKARFSVLVPQNDILKPGEFYLTTRRGKQFNSIIYGKDDPLIGSKRRDEIYLNPDDAEKLKIREGDSILLKSCTGEYSGVCRIGALHPKTVQVFWPEANVLISRRLDPVSHEPDYNTIVTIERMN
jgi:molybdopterin-dependent oxidoreductase alpha subunit